MSDFKKLNLNIKILNALEKKGYTHPTPIQLQAIPHLLEGKDLLGIAQTGTGKTAAFALPILDNLFKSENSVQHSNVRALILTPTRELATQINDNIKLYGEDLNLKSGVIFGGVGIDNQIRLAKNGFDILIATPGRLLDLINQGVIKFSQLEIFVLDEADRMLDMGFINDVKKIIAKLPKQRQTLFFSATMPKDVAVLANSILNNPVRIEVTPESTTVEKIDQKINFVDKANKSLLLKSIIENESADSLFLVFSQTKHKANRIAAFLENNRIKSAAIHGNKSQGAREKALEGFRSGEIKVLVATDIAARGIDIAGITHVINYELPNHPESYVHRIGRTGRAGRAGSAISFCDNSELLLLKDIEKTIQMKLPIDDTHPFHGVKASASQRSLLSENERPKSGYKNNGSSRQKFNFEGSRSRFNSDSNGERPTRFNDRDKFSFSNNRSKRTDFGDRKSFNEEGREGRSERSSFKKTSENKFDNRPSKGSKFRFFDKSKSRFEGDDSRPKRSRFNDDKRDNLGSDNSRDYRKSKRDFGDKKFGNRSFFEKDYSEGRKPKFGSRFGKSGDRNRRRDEDRRKFDDSENGSNSDFSRKQKSGSEKKFGSGFGAKLKRFGSKIGKFGAKKTKRF